MGDLFMLQEIQELFRSNDKYLLMCAITVLVDTMTGSAKAITNDQFSFQSKFLKRVIPKTLYYSGFLILFGGIQLTFDFPFFILACVCIIGIELKSIKENFDEIPVFQQLIDKVNEKLPKE